MTTANEITITAKLTYTAYVVRARANGTLP